jgi:hypothetical protein
VARPRYGTLIVLIGFCLALAAALYFGSRAGRTARRMHWQNEQIQPWMSVPFVAHLHHTHADLLFRAIHVEPNPRDRRPIRDIARAEKVPVSELLRDIEKAIQDANHTGPEGVPPPGKAP